MENWKKEGKGLNQLHNDEFWVTPSLIVVILSNLVLQFPNWYLEKVRQTAFVCTWFGNWRTKFDKMTMDRSWRFCHFEFIIDITKL